MPFIAQSDRKLIVIETDMNDTMVEDAIKIAVEGLELKDVTPCQVSRHVREIFDRKYHPSWHVICGTNFCTAVSHESRNFLYFS